MPVKKKTPPKKAPPKSQSMSKAAKKPAALKPQYKLGKKKFSTTLFAFIMLGVLIGGYWIIKSNASNVNTCLTCSYITNQPAEGPATYEGQTYDAKVEFEDFASNIQVGWNQLGSPCEHKYPSLYGDNRFDEQSSGGWNTWIRGYDIFKVSNDKLTAPFTAAEVPDAGQYVDLTDYQKAKGGETLYRAYQLSKYLSPYYGKNAYRLISINQNPYYGQGTSESTGNSPKLGDDCTVAHKEASAAALLKITNTGTATWGVGPGEGVDGNGDIVNLNEPSIKRPNAMLQTTIDGTKALELFGGASASVTSSHGLPAGIPANVKPGESVEVIINFKDAGKFNWGGLQPWNSCTTTGIKDQWCGGVYQVGTYEVPVQMVLPGKAWFGNRTTISFKAVDDLISSKWMNQEVGPYSSAPVTPAPTTGSGSSAAPKTEPKPSNPWESFKNWLK